MSPGAQRNVGKFFTPSQDLGDKQAASREAAFIPVPENLAFLLSFLTGEFFLLSTSALNVAKVAGKQRQQVCVDSLLRR